MVYPITHGCPAGYSTSRAKGLHTVVLLATLPTQRRVYTRLSCWLLYLQSEGFTHGCPAGYSTFGAKGLRTVVLLTTPPPERRVYARLSCWLLYLQSEGFTHGCPAGYSTVRTRKKVTRNINKNPLNETQRREYR